MRKIINLLTPSLTVIYTNAQTEKSIQQITQEVMERASIQYTKMCIRDRVHTPKENLTSMLDQSTV